MFSIRSICGGALAALLLTFGSSASAAVIDFRNSNDGASSGVSLSCDALGIINYNGCTVTTNLAGLGVDGSPDTQPGQIDGSPIFSSERLTLSFAQDMVWNNITFGLWDSNDDARLITDGGSTSYDGNGASVNLPGIVSKSLTIVAYGDITGGDFAGCIRGTFCTLWKGNDSFTLESVDVTAVPLPAAGWLLIAGVGGLVAAGRRKKKAA